MVEDGTPRTIVDMRTCKSPKISRPCTTANASDVDVAFTGVVAAGVNKPGTVFLFADSDEMPVEVEPVSDRE